MGRGGGTVVFPRLLKLAVLDQPIVDNKGVSIERSVAVTVGCWPLAVGTTMRLQWYFNGTLTTLQGNLNNTTQKTTKKINYFFFVMADVDIFFCNL